MAPTFEAKFQSRAKTVMIFCQKNSSASNVEYQGLYCIGLISVFEATNIFLLHSGQRNWEVDLFNNHFIGMRGYLDP